MAIAIRLSKSSREYIPKTQRVSYWEDLIKKLEKELESIPYDRPDAREKKKSEIESVKAAFDEAKFFLDKFNGPTVFTIHSVSKSKISNTMPKSLRKRFINASDELGISVDTIEYSREISVHICKLGIESWSNLINVKPDGTHEEIKFSEDIKNEVIEQLPDDIIKDLADEISGVINRESVKN